MEEKEATAEERKVRMETNKKTEEQRLEWKQIRKQQNKVVDAKKGC
jgi:hypothetical protein